MSWCGDRNKLSKTQVMAELKRNKKETTEIRAVATRDALEFALVVSKIMSSFAASLGLSREFSHGFAWRGDINT